MWIEGNALSGKLEGVFLFESSPDTDKKNRILEVVVLLSAV
jgi:hypothetical protein